MILKLPHLPYNYNDLEPFFDEETMIIHHTKHHMNYVNNANILLEKIPEFKHYSIDEIIKNLHETPKNFRTSLRNNAGGHLNHCLFWKGLKKGTVLNEKIKIVIEQNFNNISNFKTEFEKIAISHFGSGWIWLIQKDKKLSIVSTMNQDNPLMGHDFSGTSGYPIFGLDVWEHAYYLKYQNRRLDYIKSFWNVINWEEVIIRLEYINNKEEDCLK